MQLFFSFYYFCVDGGSSAIGFIMLSNRMLLGAGASRGPRMRSPEEAEASVVFYALNKAFRREQFQG